MEELLNHKTTVFRREQERMKMLSAIHGSSLTFQLLMERNCLAQKPKGLQTGNFGLDISLGRNTELSFPHYIDNRPIFQLDLNRN